MGIISKLIKEFESKNYHRNPYNIGAMAFYEWYSTHSKDEPMPNDMVPTHEEFKAWDQEREEYVIKELLRRLGYAAVRDWCSEDAFEGRELCAGDGQCCFYCSFWNKCPYAEIKN